VPSKLVPAGHAQVLLTSAYGATQPLQMPAYVHQEQCEMELGSLRAHGGRGVSALLAYACLPVLSGASDQPQRTCTLSRGRSKHESPWASERCPARWVRSAAQAAASMRAEATRAMRMHASTGRTARMCQGASPCSEHSAAGRQREGRTTRTCRRSQPGRQPL
jgi:hypothetical protein